MSPKNVTARSSFSAAEGQQQPLGGVRREPAPLSRPVPPRAAALSRHGPG